jgi:hypothetical protein
VPKPRNLFDHYLDAVRLLSRADVHLEFLTDDIGVMAEKSGFTTSRLELTAELRADIASFLKKKVPVQ